MLVQSTCTFPSAQSLMLVSEFSRVHSQGFFLVLYFPGLTKEEAKNCLRIETKKRFLFVKKTKVELLYDLTIPLLCIVSEKLAHVNQEM